MPSEYLCLAVGRKGSAGEHCKHQSQTGGCANKNWCQFKKRMAVD